jgi:CRP-like cAMP-binding protein
VLETNNDEGWPNSMPSAGRSDDPASNVVASIVELSSLATPPAVRPRRRPAPPPPAPDDPNPWASVLGGPLQAADVACLRELARRRVVVAGARVLTLGEPARHLVLLLNGDVVLGSRAADGSLRTERTVKGPAWVDLSTAWLQQAQSIEALALSDVTVAELPVDDLRRHLPAHPELAQRLCWALSQQVHQLWHASRNLLHNDARARLAQWLLERCPVSSGRCEFRLEERKRDIAQQLAMTPETLSRLLRGLAVSRVIQMHGYALVVPDLARLRCVADGGDPAASVLPSPAGAAIGRPDAAAYPRHATPRRSPAS